MSNWRMMIDKQFLGAWDLAGKDGKPRDYTLRIKSVASEKLKTQQQPTGQRKVVIRFDRAEKAMVANSTNCKTIEAMYGADTDGWIGKPVTLYQGTARDPSTGGMVPAIRVRPQKPRGEAEEIASQPVDETMRAAQSAAFEREPGSDDT